MVLSQKVCHWDKGGINLKSPASSLPKDKMRGPVRQPSVRQRLQANITAADSTGAYDKWLGLDRWQGGAREHRTSAPQAIAGCEDTVKPRGSSHVMSTLKLVGLT